MTQEQYQQECEKIADRYYTLQERYLKSLIKKTPVSEGDLVWLTNEKLGRTFVCEVQSLDLSNDHPFNANAFLIIRLRRLYKNGNLGEWIEAGNSIPVSALKRIRANQDPFSIEISKHEIPTSWEDWG